MPKLVVHYRMQAKPGRAGEIIALYKEGLFPVFETEAGTEQYVLCQAVDDPDVLWCHELFTSRELFDEHRQAALGDRFVPAIKELVVSVEAIQGTPVMATGVDID